MLITITNSCQVNSIRVVIRLCVKTDSSCVMHCSSCAAGLGMCGCVFEHEGMGPKRWAQQWHTVCCAAPYLCQQPLQHTHSHPCAPHAHTPLLLTLRVLFRGHRVSPLTCPTATAAGHATPLYVLYVYTPPTCTLPHSTAPHTHAVTRFPVVTMDVPLQLCSQAGTRGPSLSTDVVEVGGVQLLHALH